MIEPKTYQALCAQSFLFPFICLIYIRITHTHTHIHISKVLYGIMFSTHLAYGVLVVRVTMLRHINFFAFAFFHHKSQLFPNLSFHSVQLIDEFQRKMEQFVTHWENEEIVRQRGFEEEEKVETNMLYLIIKNESHCEELLCSCHICNDSNV